MSRVHPIPGLFWPDFGLSCGPLAPRASSTPVQDLRRGKTLFCGMICWLLPLGWLRQFPCPPFSPVNNGLCVSGHRPFYTNHAGLRCTEKIVLYLPGTCIVQFRMRWAYQCFTASSDARVRLSLKEPQLPGVPPGCTTMPPVLSMGPLCRQHVPG
jgi:hypothetical protein